MNIYINYFVVDLFSLTKKTARPAINIEIPAITMIAIGKPPNKAISVLPKRPAAICGMVIVALNNPIYTPILSAGNEPDNMA